MEDDTLVTLTMIEVAHLANLMERNGEQEIAAAIDAAINKIADGVDSAQVTILVVKDDL